MQDHDRSFLGLLILGAMIALGKLLVSHEVLTLRLVVGRTILGSATSIVAGVLLLQFKDINPLALLGFGSALGIAGSEVIQAYMKRKAASA